MHRSLLFAYLLPRELTEELRRFSSFRDLWMWNCRAWVGRCAVRIDPVRWVPREGESVASEGEFLVGRIVQLNVLHVGNNVPLALRCFLAVFRYERPCSVNALGQWLRNGPARGLIRGRFPVLAPVQSAFGSAP